MPSHPTSVNIITMHLMCRWEGGINPRIADFPKAQGCMLPMGVTSENVAAQFGVSRKTQVRAAGKFADLRSSKQWHAGAAFRTAVCLLQQ